MTGEEQITENNYLLKMGSMSIGDEIQFVRERISFSDIETAILKQHGCKWSLRGHGGVIRIKRLKHQGILFKKLLTIWLTYI